MAKLLIVLLISFCLVGCKQRQPPGATAAPGAPGQAPGVQPPPGPNVQPPPGPGVQPPPGPGAPEGKQPENKTPPPSRTDQDGPTLDKLLVGAVKLKVSAIPAKKSDVATEVTDAKAVQAVLAAVNTKQQAKGGFQPCQMRYGFEVTDAQGKELAFFSICGPFERGKPARGSVANKQQKVEWAITVPDGLALSTLLGKYSPRK